jgi:hypothetical protein
VLALGAEKLARSWRNNRLRPSCAQGLPAEPEPLVLPAFLGGPPARVDEDGLSRMPGELVARVAQELRDHDQAWARAAYAREREHIEELLGEDEVVEDCELLRDFFVSAAASGSDVVVGWEYR